MKRRHLLQWASAASLWAMTHGRPAQAQTINDPILVVIYLKGGNDALNTVVPNDVEYSTYQAVRPTLAWDQGDLIPLDNKVAFAPPLAPLYKYHQQGKLATLLGVGVPRNTLSLFAHNDQRTVWDTGDIVSMNPTNIGWMARYLQNVGLSNNPLIAFNGVAEIPQVLGAEGVFPTAALRGLDAYALHLGGVSAAEEKKRQDVLKLILQVPPRTLIKPATQWMSFADEVKASFDQALGYQPTVAYPACDLGRQLEDVAALISSNAGQRFFYCELADFDTHDDQNSTHPGLLSDLATSIDAFWTDMQNQGLTQRIVVMTYSEFGRRPTENSSGGTDHGMAGVSFVLGDQVIGNIYGSYTPLSYVVKNVDVAPFYDNIATAVGMEFYNMYATVLSKHMGFPTANGFVSGLNPTAPHAVRPIPFM